MTHTPEDIISKFSEIEFRAANLIRSLHTHAIPHALNINYMTEYNGFIRKRLLEDNQIQVVVTPLGKKVFLLASRVMELRRRLVN